MIEQLKNCPQCGGILNEAGRCEFCGSKVYDFLNLDFGPKNKYQSAKTYIRIKSGNVIYLTPIVVRSCSITERAPVIEVTRMDTYHPSYIRGIPEMNIELDCIVVGDMHKIVEDESNET